MENNLYKNIKESYGAKENTLDHDAGYLFDIDRCKEYLRDLKNVLVYNSDQYIANIQNLDKGQGCYITIDYYMLVALCKMYEERIKELESSNLNESDDSLGVKLSAPMKNKLMEFRRQVYNDFEQFEEDMMNDDTDVFGGTEDSYANEMLWQHLSDTVYYLFEDKFDVDTTDRLTNVFTGILVDAYNENKLDYEIGRIFATYMHGLKESETKNNIIKESQIGMSDDDTEKIFNAIIDTAEKLGYQDCSFYIGDPNLGNSGTINLDNNYFIKINSWGYPADVSITLVEKYDKDKPNFMMGKTIAHYSIKDIADIDGSYNKDIDTEVIPEVNELLTKIITDYKNINRRSE